MPGGPIIIIDPKTQRAELYYSNAEAVSRYRELAEELDAETLLGVFPAEAEDDRS